MARAEITRRTRLNRSTVGALVGELVELGLAFETPPEDQSLRGRPSAIVHPNAKVAALAINPDVDALTLGLVGLGGVVHKRVRYELDKKPSPELAIRLVTRLVDGMSEELRSEYRLVGAGLAIPGLVRHRDGLVRRAPYLDWTNEPFTERMGAALGLPTYAGNDAGIAMISESLYGVGRGVKNLVYLNGFAVGIGGGVMVAGIPLRGEDGYAAELGHTLVPGSLLPCHCGRRGCLETEVNAARLRAVIGSDSLDLDELDTVLATTDDQAVRKEAERQVAVLADAIANFISVFNPKMVVLGGFLASLHAAMPDRFTKAIMEASFQPVAEGVRIERAVLRSRLLMVGAAELAFTPLLLDPAGNRAAAVPV
jgi:predicted NBD/HSP70 family sugar kinase